MPEITKGTSDDVALQQVHTIADRHIPFHHLPDRCKTDDCPYPAIGTVTYGFDGTQHHVCAICAVDLIDWRASHLDPTFAPAGIWPTAPIMAEAVAAYHAAWIAHGRFAGTGESIAGYHVECFCGGWTSVHHPTPGKAADEHLGHRWETARRIAAETMLKAA